MKTLKILCIIISSCWEDNIKVFSNTGFEEAFRNTAFIAGVSVILEFLIALGLALLINKKFKGAGIFLPGYDTNGYTTCCCWGNLEDHFNYSWLAK